MVRRSRYLAIAFLVVASLALAQDTKENADFKLAVSLYNDKLYDLALEQFRQFVAAFPNTQQGIEARFYLGETQLALGLHRDALQTFQNFAISFADHPKAPQAWWKVAESNVALGNLREAAVAYERVKTFHPKSPLAPEALVKSGEYFRRAGDPGSAVTVLRTLVQDYGSSAVVLPARIALSELYLEGQQYELARVEAKRVVDAGTDPAHLAHGLFLMASALAQQGKYDEARGALQRVVSEYSSSASAPEALFQLGVLQRDAGDFEEAVSSWTTLITKYAKADPMLLQRASVEAGGALRDLGRHAESATMFERGATYQGPDTREALFRAGLANDRAGNSGRAAEFYGKAFADTSGDFDERLLLIGAYKASLLKKNYRTSLGYAEEIGRLYPADPITPLVMLSAASTASDQLGDYRRALGFLDEIQASSQSHSLSDDAVLMAASALEKSGLTQQAYDLLLEFPKDFPSSELRDKAHVEAERVYTFELKESGTGVENLAGLMGDMIAQKNPGELAYRLADLYMNDLKDYRRASEQYSIALQYELDSDERETALFQGAMCLRNLAWKGELDGRTRQQDFARAVAALDTVLAAYPDGQYAHEAALLRLTLALKGSSDVLQVREAAERYMAQHPEGPEKGAGLILIGERYALAGRASAAQEVYRAIIQRYRGTEATGTAMVRLAEGYNGMARPDSALLLLDEFIAEFQKHQESSRAAFIVAGLEKEKGNTSRALELYERIATEFSYTAYADSVPERRGDALFASGRYEEAAREYQRSLDAITRDIITLKQPSPPVILKLAACYQRAGRSAEAKAAFLQYLAADPSTSLKGDVYYALAALVRMEGNSSLAIKYLKQAAESAADPLLRERASLEAADLLFESEEYDGAIRQYREVQQLTKNDTLAQYAEARSVVGLYRLDNLQEADRRAQAFIKARPKAVESAAEFQFERGRSYVRKTQFDLAMRQFTTVTKDYRRSAIAPEATYWTGRVYELQNKPGEAVKVYQRVLEDYPRHEVAPRARLGLGNAYYSLEQFENAMKQFKPLVDDPATPPELRPLAMNNLILAYKSLQLFDAALQLTRDYIEQYPDDPDLISKTIDIGVLYQRLGYYDQSVLHLQSMLETADAQIESELRYYIGEAYYYKGDFQQAILEFLKVPYLISKDGRGEWIPPSYYMAGQAYEKMSRFEQAIAMYRQIIDRPGIDATFKTAAQKEIDRVRTLLRK